MDIRGYEIGPIKADAAFTSDFAIPDDMPVRHLVDMVEIERRSMDVRPGMRLKYMPSTLPRAPAKSGVAISSTPGRMRSITARSPARSLSSSPA